MELSPQATRSAHGASARQSRGAGRHVQVARLPHRSGPLRMQGNDPTLAAHKRGVVAVAPAVNMASNMQQTLPWIVALVAVAVLAPAVVWFALRPRVPKATPLPTEWNLSAR